MNHILLPCRSCFVLNIHEILSLIPKQVWQKVDIEFQPTQLKGSTSFYLVRFITFSILVSIKNSIKIYLICFNQIYLMYR